MDERGIIDYIRSLQDREDGVLVEPGPGDDAACVRLPGAGRAVLSTDMVIEGTHFPSGATPESVGVKAVGRALSDLAAMAALPVCSLMSVIFPPERSDRYQRGLCRSIHEECRRLGAPLVGGDTGSGTERLVVTMTVIGAPGPGGLISRSGARAGDSICVTGALGGSLSGRHMVPRPRIDQALALARGWDIHAMIDISDGLATDLLHIAGESGVGVRVEGAAIPVHNDAVEAAAAGREEEGRVMAAVRHAIDDGEDYELLFCVGREDAGEIVATGIKGLDVSIIGTVSEDGEKRIVWPDGTETELKDTGWRHLKKR